MKKKIRNVVRGICIQKDNVLLAKSVDKDNFHLPGGGINKFESARVALLREIKEELGIDANIKEFIGVIENCWIDKDIMISIVSH